MYYARNTKNLKNCLLLFEWKDEGVEFIVFDVESTGLDVKKDYIVELGAKKYKIKKKAAECIETLHLYIKPPFYMDEKVVEIHKITNDFLDDKPSETEIFNDIKTFFGTHPILIGYNIDFDIGMLSSLYERNHSVLTPQIALDVREMGYDVINDKEIPDHKLETLVQSFGLDVGLRAHNAIDDAEATYRLLLYCYNEYKQITINPCKQKVYINAIYYWKGFRKEQSGIYLKTNLGVIYLSTYLKLWCSSQVDLSLVDIDAMENEVLSKTGISFKELGKMTERKFAVLKNTCRERGVYL